MAVLPLRLRPRLVLGEFLTNRPPSVLDAAFATIEAITTTTNRVLAVAARGLVCLGAQLAEPLRGKHAEERPNMDRGKDFECLAGNAGLEEPDPSC